MELVAHFLVSKGRRVLVHRRGPEGRSKNVCTMPDFHNTSLLTHASRTKGNFKIKEHVQLRRHIFLFQKAKLNEKLHRYVGEFRCNSTRVVDGMDSENKPRKEFKFILTRLLDPEHLCALF
jgi:hypothetical protein